MLLNTEGGNNTNISIGFHIPELQQSRPQYGVITVFRNNICGEIVWMDFDENLGMQALLPS